MTEYKILIHLPITPVAGDRIDAGDMATRVDSEFARLAVGEDRFGVAAKDGRYYEVKLESGGPRNDTPRTWKAVREIPRTEFNALSVSSTRN